MTDIHLTTLATWIINTLGKALAVSIAVAVACGVLSAITQEPGVFAIAGLFAPLAFAAVLYNASAPLPYSAEDLGLEGEGGDAHGS